MRIYDFLFDAPFQQGQKGMELDENFVAKYACITNYPYSIGLKRTSLDELSVTIITPTKMLVRQEHMEIEGGSPGILRVLVIIYGALLYRSKNSKREFKSM